MIGTRTPGLASAPQSVRRPPRVLTMTSTPVSPDRQLGRAMALAHIDGAGMRTGFGR
jgi:hypothetical protein